MLFAGAHLGDGPAFIGTLYFSMMRVAELYERFKDKVEMVWPLERTAYGTLEFGVRDPALCVSVRRAALSPSSARVCR
jgi:hypothetical protein